MNWKAHINGSETRYSAYLRAAATVVASLLILVVVIAVAGVCLAGCSNPTRNEWTEGAYPTEHDVFRGYRVDGVTPGGLRYQGAAEENTIDDIVANTFACLANGPSRIDPQHLAAAGQCLWRDMRLPEADSFIVVVADSVPSCAMPDFEVVVGTDLPKFYQAAGAKGQGSGDDECPYRWRALFREADDGTPLLVVAEDLRMLPDVITRWATACRNPWVAGFPFQACAAPYREE